MQAKTDASVINIGHRQSFYKAAPDLRRGGAKLGSPKQSSFSVWELHAHVAWPSFNSHEAFTAAVSPQASIVDPACFAF